MNDASSQHACPRCRGTNLTPGRMSGCTSFTPEGAMVKSYALIATACLDCGRVEMSVPKNQIGSVRAYLAEREAKRDRR